MYLKNIAIKDIGPIEKLSVELPFKENGDPKPIIFVGENGTGKTMLQSQIMDAFYQIAGDNFDDVRKLEGLGYKFYKVSGGGNLRIGAQNGFSLLSFEDKSKNKIEYFDKINQVTKDDFINLIPNFVLSPENGGDNQKATTNLDKNKKKELQQEWYSGSYFYQPAYRFEEPFWKNDVFAVNDDRYGEKKIFSNHLNKELEIITSLKENKSFLMDLVLDFTNDSNANANKTLQEIRNKITNKEEVGIIDTYTPSLDDQVIWSNVNQILRKIRKTPSVRLGIGSRGDTRISIVKIDGSGNVVGTDLQSLDGLSLGETVIFNLFLNIIRHASNKQLNNIEGIVVIDEIDVHLHTNLQNEILPEIIQMFPKVQFIITTHSPLFVLGMEKKFGDEFELREMPTGDVVTAERFSEFEHAYDVLKKTEKFNREIKEEVLKAAKPIFFVEGDYDIEYIKKAAELLGKGDVFGKVEIRDGGGWGNLDKIWQNFNNKTKLSKIIPQKVILLYDCDTKKQDDIKAKVFKRVIPGETSPAIEKGIENLFDKSLLERAIKVKKAYIDITPAVTKVERGKDILVPEKWEVNLDEKGNLCEWICNNGTKDDFKNFEKVFKIIEDCISSDDSKGLEGSAE